MLYSQRLREIRENKDMRISDIAKTLKIDESVYGKYEREYVLMPTKHLNTICNYFNVSLDYVFNLSDDLNYNNTTKEINKELSAKRLKEFRKENKLTQIKLAAILNASPAVIVHHENKRFILATPFLYTICSKYHISADYLLGKIDSPKYLK
ncbi:MAG: helix-turn-helix domain-containing protein [Ruminococcus sp.]|nr:helix-turn-helix domain-containing protein [Ruminococcus sp.]